MTKTTMTLARHSPRLTNRPLLARGLGSAQHCIIVPGSGAAAAKPSAHHPEGSKEDAVAARKRSDLEIIAPKNMYTTPSYNHVARVGNLLFLAGQVSRDENG